MNKLRLITLACLTATLALTSGCDTDNDTTAQSDTPPAKGALVAPVRQDNMIATLRNGIPLNEEAVPPAIPKVIETDFRRSRNYPMQPPLIPHDIRDYDVNLKANRCMACHARGEVKDTQAPMISVTHYMDRSGNFLAEISPRRYFCNQCHVVQTTAADTVDNTFEDMDILVRKRAAAQEN